MDRYQSEIDQALELASVMGDDASTCRDSFQPIKSRKASKKKAEADSHDKWADEIYERAVLPKGTDSAFSRFATVVGHNSEQVMRYQYGGVPLLYSMQDSVAKMLVASKSQQSQKPRPDTKAKYPNTGKDYESEDDDSDSENDDSTTTDTNSRQIYSTKALPRCTFCGGQRTFECQLMPALLTELPLANNYHRHHTHLTSQRNNSGADSSVQKRLVGSQLLQSLDLGVEFGTMMVFVCENDCHDGKTGLDYLSRDAHSMAKYAAAVYYEELVLVQQEVHID
ncbi:hypothetical protein EV175_002849 [Coemansia sp. RSA 1933]|nr:hypothetical protein EV175_002849 [Coemansia sp. RSA 1933]